MADMDNESTNANGSSKNSGNNNGKSPTNSKRRRENIQDKQNSETITISRKSFIELRRHAENSKESICEVLNKIHELHMSSNDNRTEPFSMNEASSSVTLEKSVWTDNKTSEPNNANITLHQSEPILASQTLEPVFERNTKMFSSIDAESNSHTIRLQERPDFKSLPALNLSQSGIFGHGTILRSTSPSEQMEIAPKTLVGSRAFKSTNPLILPLGSSEQTGGSIETFYAEINELKNELMKVGEENNLLKTTNIDWQKFHNQREVEFSQLQNQLQDVQRKLSDEGPRFNPQQQEIVDKKFQEMRLIFDSQKEELQNKVDELNTILQQKSEEFRSSEESLTEQVSSLTRDKHELSAQVAELTSALVVVSRSNSSRSKKLEDFGRERRILEENIRQLTHDSESQKAQLQRNQSEIGRLRQSQQENFFQLRGPPSTTNRKSPSPRAIVSPAGTSTREPPGANVMTQSLNFSPGFESVPRNYGNAVPGIAAPPGYRGYRPPPSPGNEPAYSAPPSEHSDEMFSGRDFLDDIQADCPTA